jgi:hypothetical protein
MTLLLGLASLAILLWAAQKYLKADPRKLAAVLKMGGGIALLALAAFLGLRGQIAIAAPLAAAGLALLGWLPFSPAGFGGRTQKSQGQTSRVRSRYLDMELDHDSGAMRGTIIAGPRAGTRLDALDSATLAQMLGEIDEESRALLAAYLDGRDPGWREHAQSDAAAGRGGAASRGPMTREEAYEVLGLKAGASTEDVVNAHRTLMKKLHPDLGGTNYLAARINEAKDTLLGQHR